MNRSNLNLYHTCMHIRFYTIHNWVKLMLFCVLPAIVLIMANSYLLHAMHKALKLRDSCRKNMFGTARKYKIWRVVFVYYCRSLFSFQIGTVLGANVVDRNTNRHRVLLLDRRSTDAFHFQKSGHCHPLQWQRRSSCQFARIGNSQANLHGVECH